MRQHIDQGSFVLLFLASGFFSELPFRGPVLSTLQGVLDLTAFWVSSTG